MENDKLLYRRLCQSRGTKTVVRKGCVIREVQQQLLQNITSVERVKAFSREDVVS
jgi:hypothetical protein